ncbi:transketolase family protein [Acidisoma sp. L85]|jgi:transketolase|uniref:transketolase family protein n=1 Tax=Acidisoma sp. L85 TaxID=1641850 RepID=UPI00131A889D|nr:transketolase C-terminal domain-containing protein [Acidisoma sp. L85]
MKLVRQPTVLQDEASFDHEGRAGVPARTLGTILSNRADTDSRLVVATADLAWSTFVAEFLERHPRRFFQAGISERNMLGFAAGLAASGYIPYVTTFSAFASLQSLDVIRNDHAYTNLPVRTIGTHCGISMGYFASSHHAIEDIGALRSIPNLTVVAAADLNAMEGLLRDVHDLPGPVYIRFGRGADGPPVYQAPNEVRFGEVTQVHEGRDILLLTTGIGVHAARDAARALGEEGGLSVTVGDLHTIRPFPIERIAALAARHRAVVVAEDHVIDGGIGTSVQQALLECGVDTPVFKHGLRDFAIVGPPSHMYRYYGLDALGMAIVVRRAAERLEQPASTRYREALWGSADMARILAEQGRADLERQTSSSGRFADAVR